MTKNKKIVAFGLLVMSLTMACNSALAPILAEIGNTFPNESDASIQVVLTIINLICLPFMLVVNELEYYFTKKSIAMAGTALMLIGALVPQVLSSQLWMLYLASGIIGAGLALVVVVSSTLISDNFSGIEKSKIMGFQSIFVSIGGTIIAKGSGLFTAMAGWKNGYLVFLICVPILLIIQFTVPKGEVIPKTEKGKSQISGSMIYFGLLCLVTGIFVATFNTNIAMYLQAKEIGDANLAGTVASIFQVIGIAGGFLLGNVVASLKRFTIGAMILLMAGGTILVGVSNSVPMICIGAAIVGFGFAIRNPGAVTFAANMVAESQAAMAIAMVSATYNLGNFVSPYIVNAMANAMGNDISMRFITSGIALAVVAVIAIVKAPTTDAEALNSQKLEESEKSNVRC